MPLLKNSGYRASLLFKNRHLNTIYPSLFRKITPVRNHRSRIGTPDKDFIDLDFTSKKSNKIVILLHGLEGSSKSKSIQGMVRIFDSAGYDTVSMNFRGCSGEPNNTLRSYHSGETEDLQIVINHVQSLKIYNAIHLVAFSLGGNVLLKYLGEKGTTISGDIHSAVALSVPCDLHDSSIELAKSENSIYMKRFIKELGTKMQIKSTQFPGLVDITDYKTVKTFKHFDERFTAPIHGFLSAEDYWEKSSSIGYLHKISIPTLLINALDDPFLGNKSYPYKEADQSKFLYLETPRYGGHVGFTQLGAAFYWSEKRALEFIKQHG